MRLIVEVAVPKDVRHQHHHHHRHMSYQVVADVGDDDVDLVALLATRLVVYGPQKGALTCKLDWLGFCR